MSSCSTEIWKPVVGYEGFYEVSNFGRVRSVTMMTVRATATETFGKYNQTIWKQRQRRGRILKILHGGSKDYSYPKVSLSKNNKITQCYIHDLVLTAFVGPRPEGMEACHFPDESHYNNRLDNLRWDTHKNNYGDSVKSGRAKKCSGFGWETKP